MVQSKLNWLDDEKIHKVLTFRISKSNLMQNQIQQHT